MLRSIAYEATDPIVGGGGPWLEGLLGFESSVVKLKLTMD